MAELAELLSAGLNDTASSIKGGRRTRRYTLSGLTSDEKSGLDRHAHVIQSKFKRHRLVFGQLGPNIFCRKGGAPADYGQLYFPERNDEAPFITVSDTTSTGLLSSFMASAAAAIE